MNHEVRPVALLTGAGRGIGRATALALAEDGYDVVLTARTTRELQVTADGCRERGAVPLVIPGDLRDDALLRRLVDESLSKLGRLDVLVNNAGVNVRAPVQEIDLQDLDRVMEVNVRAAMHLTRRALPHIVRSDAGAVLFVSSIAGKMSFARGSAYSASKHALLGFAGSVFEDVREAGVKVCTLCPGYVNTPLVTADDLDREKMIQPADIAAVVRFVLGFPGTGCPTEIVVRPQRTPYR